MGAEVTRFKAVYGLAWVGWERADEFRSVRGCGPLIGVQDEGRPAIAEMVADVAEPEPGVREIVGRQKSAGLSEGLGKLPRRQYQREKLNMAALFRPFRAIRIWKSSPSRLWQSIVRAGMN